MVWSLQDAKNRFSEVVERSQTEGPQKVLKHGKEVVVVVSCEQWAELQGERQTLGEFLSHSPLVGVELEILRDKTPIRSLDL